MQYILFATQTTFLLNGASVCALRPVSFLQKVFHQTQKFILGKNEFLLLYNLVESSHFTWSRFFAELSILSAEQFHWLMQGVAIDFVIHIFQLALLSNTDIFVLKTNRKLFPARLHELIHDSKVIHVDESLVKVMLFVLFIFYHPI